MPITMNWVDDVQTTLDIKFTESWTAEEFSQWIDELHMLLKDVDNPVWAIVDGTNSEGLPRGGKLLQQFPRLFVLSVEHTVIISSSAIARAVISAFLKLKPTWDKHVTFVDNLASAHSLIEEMQENRTDILPPD